MKNVFVCLLTLISLSIYGQQTGAFYVAGDSDKFYPVTFIDGGWGQNIATTLEIGRSSTSVDSPFRGALIGTFKFHNSRWGNGAEFMRAEIFQSVGFIGGWHDATINNANFETIIWLKGGGTTYYYKSNVATNPLVYDGVQHPLPLLEENGPSHSFKTAIDDYVNFSGLSTHGTAYFSGNNSNYFAGNVGIGTTTPRERLSVNGNIRAREIKVETNNWPDYVFRPSYPLPSLGELKTYIDYHQHLPGIPSEQEVKANGIDVGDMNAKLLQKIEELTLYIIQVNKEVEQLKAVNRALETKR